jgi:hypothetical protein
VSGYIDAGYAIVLGSLGLYGVSLVARERAARRRAGTATERPASPEPPEREQP